MSRPICFQHLLQEKARKPPSIIMIFPPNAIYQQKTLSGVPFKFSVKYMRGITIPASSPFLPVIRKTLFSLALGTRLIATGLGDIPEIEVFDGDTVAPANERTDNSGLVTFPDTAQGTASPAKIFTIRNTGTADLTGINISILGTSAAEYHVTSGPSATVTAGGTTTFSVTFSPTGPFERNAVAAIASNAPDENPFEIPLTGKAAAPEISLESPEGSILESGRLFAWGRDEHHQTTITTAARFGVRKVALGNWHSMALKNDGTLIPWGEGYNNEPTVPAGLGLITDIAAGLSYNVAVKQNGSLFAWGSNFQRQLSIPTVTNAKTVSAGVNHGIVLKTDGTVEVWGSGNASIYPSTLSGTNVKAIAAGYYHNLSLKNDGTVVSWGANTGISSPYQVPGLTNVTAVSAGNGYSLALKADGTVWRWTNGVTPTQLAVSGATAVSAGGAHYAVLKEDGSVLAFGSNTYGQTDVPANLPRITAIKAGDVNTMAIATSRLDFGNRFVSSTNPAKTVVVKNSGSEPLHINTVTIPSGNAADFILNTAGMLTTVPVGGQTNFSISFSPAASGSRAATLRVTNDDPDENFYEIDLVGIGRSNGDPLTALEAWRQTYFGDYTETGEFANLADFDKDGISNILEYAFGTDPTRSTPSDGRISTSRSDNHSIISYRRPEGGISGVTYGIELSNSDMSAWTTGIVGTDYTQTLTPNGDGTETVVITLPEGPNASRFFRIRVSN